MRVGLERQERAGLGHLAPVAMQCPSVKVGLCKEGSERPRYSKLLWLSFGPLGLTEAAFPREQRNSFSGFQLSSLSCWYFSFRLSPGRSAGFAVPELFNVPRDESSSHFLTRAEFSSQMHHSSMELFPAAQPIFPLLFIKSLTKFQSLSM